MFLKVNNCVDSYATILDTILTQGKEVSPRNMKTFELSPLVIKFANNKKRLIFRDGFNLTFHLREVSDYINGSNPGHTIRYNSNMKQFLNDNGKFDGFYGDRINLNGQNQLFRVAEQLIQDKDSRRAVITIHNSAVENYFGKDVACTVDLHFMVRDNKLETLFHIRSSDWFLGVVYDLPTFMFFQDLVAGFVGVESGDFTYIGNSAHVYERDIEKIRTLKVPETVGIKFSYLSLEEFNKIWAQKEQAEELTRNSKYREALKIAKDIAHPYYQSWAGIMVFYEALKFGKNRQIAEEALSIVSNEFRYWGEQKLENSKNSSKD